MADRLPPPAGIQRHHQRRLAALFAHPLHRDLRTSQVEALLRSLGASVTPLDGRRLRIQMPGGEETWIHASCGLGRPFLDADALMRVRHLLQAAGVGPSVEHAQLRPHGLWGSGENLSHRHDRDIAGQRAPLDHAYLRCLVGAIEQADAVLLLGHGTGESDMRQLLLNHLHSHHRPLLERIVGVVTLDQAHPSEGELLALARDHFGYLPERRQRPGAAPPLSKAQR